MFGECIKFEFKIRPLLLAADTKLITPDDFLTPRKIHGASPFNIDEMDSALTTSLLKKKCYEKLPAGSVTLKKYLRSIKL